jgi:nucleoside-diphosphate-sugar epimerase
MKYLLMGGSGFLGQGIVKQLLKTKGTKISVLDNFSFSEPETSIKDARIDISYGDVGSQTSVQACLNRNIPDITIFLAGFHAFNPGSDSRLETSRVTSSLLYTIPFLARQKSKLFVYISADFAYKRGKEKVTELDPLDWGTPDTHSMQKIIGEWYTAINCRRYRVPYLILRPSFIIGERKFANPFVDPLIFTTEVLLNETPFILTKANQKRDYIHLSDAAQMIVNIIKSDKYNTVYNISSGAGVTNKQLLDYLQSTIESKSEIKIVDSSEPDIVLDNTKTMDIKSIKLSKVEELIPKIVNYRRSLRDVMEPESS